ncbi:protein-glutamate O-methyltransferase CheR [bacterium]|nr:protein-glutamate O-methyltransferase CheR [bacterium]
MTLSQEDFSLVQDMLSQRVGISLAAGKEYLVVNRLSPLVDTFQFDSLHGLIHSLQIGSNSNLWDEVVDVLAVHETFFFRDQAPFQQLEKDVLPAICKEAERTGRKITIWSAGCSTGQEAYSIAMLLAEIAPQLSKRVQIIGSDVSSKVLQSASEGVYRKFEVSRGLSSSRLNRFFEPVESGWQVKKNLRSMMEWKKFSLAGTWPSLPQFDLVLLRNVMVYFQPAVREQLIKRITPLLRPNGRFVVGSAESLMAYEHTLQTVSSMNATHYVVPQT